VPTCHPIQSVKSSFNHRKQRGEDERTGEEQDGFGADDLPSKAAPWLPVRAQQNPQEKVAHDHKSQQQRPPRRRFEPTRGTHRINCVFTPHGLVRAAHLVNRVLRQSCDDRGSSRRVEGTEL
jgi:hypothetical protein